MNIIVDLRAENGDAHLCCCSRINVIVLFKVDVLIDYSCHPVVVCKSLSQPAESGLSVGVLLVHQTDCVLTLGNNLCIITCTVH